jgi:hypothetical protein
MNMKWFLSRCRRRQQDISLLAGGALSGAERSEIESHLAVCADCRAQYERIKSVTVPLSGLRASVAQIEPRVAAQQRWARDIRAAGAQGVAGPMEPDRSFNDWWRELFWSCRHVWGGIAALWLVMWAVNWGQPGSHAAAASGSPPVITQTFEEEREALAELLPPFDREPAEPPRRNPPPHSERQRAWIIC